MNPQKSAQALSEITQAAGDEMRRIGEQESCIFAAVTLAEVFRRKGYPGARPISVRAKILNPAFHSWVKAHGLPRDPAGLAGCEAQGGSIVQLGVERGVPLGPDIWNGHLATMVPGGFGDRHALIDITIIQVNKPEWEIDIPLLVIPVDDGFASGQRERNVEARGCLISYKAFPLDKDHESTPIYAAKGAWKAAADRILARLA